MQHSTVVGGSTAKRVINCPGSVALCDKTPKPPSNKYADEGTLCHTVIEAVLDERLTRATAIGMKYNDIVMTEELYDTKVNVALQLLEEVDPAGVMEFDLESRVSYEPMIEGAFGTSDLIGRIGKRAIVLDWKFGDGVIVDAEENEQGLYYAGGAMTLGHWAFRGAEEVEIVIVQPPAIRRWVTTPARVQQFISVLTKAVKQSKLPDAPIVMGDHCRWCHAKQVCPQMNGAVDRALRAQLDVVDAKSLSTQLGQADILEQWITSVRAAAHMLAENGIKVPGYKLVAKRAIRKWTDEQDAKAALLDLGVKESDVTETSLLSPAQAEKVLKKHKLVLPDQVVVAVSSGSSLVEENDPRPELLNIGQQLKVALNKLQ